MLVRPISLLRNYILPLGALLLLLVQATQVSATATPVRIVATALGFVVLILVLSGLKATLFQGAPEGSWRKRIPSIFLDVARFVVIAVGLAVIFSYIWGANVGGLFTALGNLIDCPRLGVCRTRWGRSSPVCCCCSSSPFRSATGWTSRRPAGRVIEVNWRATHIDTGGGLQVIPKLDAGRCVVHQFESAVGSSLDLGGHGVLGGRSARRCLRNAGRRGRPPSTPADRRLSQSRSDRCQRVQNVDTAEFAR